MGEEAINFFIDYLFFDTDLVKLPKMQIKSKSLLKLIKLIDPAAEELIQKASDEYCKELFQKINSQNSFLTLQLALRDSAHNKISRNQ